MDVRIETVPRQRVAFLRHVGPYQEVGATWNRLMEWAGARGLLERPNSMLGLAHDDPSVTPAAELRYDACVPAPATFQAEGEIGTQEIGGGEYAVALHRGPYERLHETYARVRDEWLPASGRALRNAPCMERYLNTPLDSAPEGLLTELCLPLE